MGTYLKYVPIAFSIRNAVSSPISQAQKKLPHWITLFTCGLDGGKYIGRDFNLIIPTMPKRTDLKTILIIGSGPIVIGQACEFDYS